MKRVFLIVLDSMGVGEMPDAWRFHDEGSNTLGAIAAHENFSCPTLTRMGLFAIDGVKAPVRGGDAVGVSGKGGASGTDPLISPSGFCASYGRLAERSAGKDTTIGHWEIAGVISETPMPLYPEGFPPEIIEPFKKLTGRGVLCNKPYPGTDVIRDYGKEHIATGDLIVYTSGDSVFQLAAHEDVVPPAELYRYCEIARGLLVGKHGVGRVIARPFAGDWPYVRTANRHDFSLKPPKPTMIDALASAGFDTLSVGKIYDIFAGCGVKESHRSLDNADGMRITAELAEKDFCGLCFVNLVDFDMKFGHRNDVAGYAAAMTAFDRWLAGFLPRLKAEDLLIITADHGCDPSTPSTDHSREYTPLIVYGESVHAGVNLGTRPTFADIGASVLDYFGLDTSVIAGESFLPLLR